MDNKLALLGPYRGVVPTIVEKPAAPNRKLARTLRKVARQKRRIARKQAWQEFWAKHRAEKEGKRLERKTRAESKAERLKVLEEQVLPEWLKTIEKYANSGDRKVHLSNAPISLDEHDLLYMKDILRRYGFSCRRKEKEKYYGKHYFLKVKW